MKGKIQATVFLVLLNVLTFYAQVKKDINLKTTWAEKVTKDNVWQEYPRPQLEREEWLNLNGYWDYAIVGKNENEPEKYQGKILVPFCVESELSGVKKTVTPDDMVWYNTSFNLPKTWDGKNILLHFDAVDWQTNLWVNGKKVGEHKGGNDPFYFDITPYLKKGKQEVKISVWDPTDTESQARGKQVLNPKGIWYTAVTGIWQTVWVEPVSKTYIESIVPVPDIDNKQIIIENNIINASKNTALHVQVKKDGKTIAEGSTKANENLSIDIPNPKLWTPESPFLYQLEVSLAESDRKVDNISSYFAMRKISKGKDEFGHERILLNNEPRFQYGTLDQGWWPGGLLTPPSDQAMRFDIDMLKKMGFNMLRKHIKVEPSRYYYYADKVGILVWQDMVSGFETAQREIQHVKPDGKDWNRPKASASEYEREWKAIMDHLKFFPSIVTWVPFNEGWGQYETERIVKWTEQYDPTRLVDGVSGWADRNVGDMNDAHHYPGPGMEPAEQNPNRIIVLGEFGGLGLPIDNHIWNPEMRNWGYRTYTSKQELKKQYTALIRNMAPMINNGLAAAVYTQTTDVEGEVNGLITYDRKVVKIDTNEVKQINSLLYHQPLKTAIIVADSEVDPSKIQVSDEDPYTEGKLKKKSFNTKQGTVSVEKGKNVWLLKSFQLDKLPKNLQLRIYGAGDIKILINDKLAIDKEIRTKRHYDEINLNEYLSLLQTGTNHVVIEVKNTRRNIDFDFGLYTY